MSKSVVTAFYIAAMVIVIIGLDVSIFRNHAWPRLAANVAVVLLVGALWFRYVGRV